MSVSSFLRDGRVIAAGLGVASVILVTGVHLVLEYIRDQNEVEAPQSKTQYITQETEDSLKPNTLDSLLGHYNYAIRETAAKIICDRALNDPEAIELLLYGITRPDYDERMKNLRALALIMDPNCVHVLNTQKACSALVRSLELCAEEYPPRKLDDRFYDDYPIRDMSEKLCLMFVILLLKKYGSDKFIKARIVDKWVAKQGWGDNVEERQFNFGQYLSRHRNRVSDVCQKLNDTRSGREALVRAGLVPKESCNEDNAAGRTRPFSIVLSISVAGEDGEHSEDLRVEAFQPRVMEQSEEEQRLRRQHREAMVLNDGTRPLGRGDIIERDRHD